MNNFNFKFNKGSVNWNPNFGPGAAGDNEQNDGKGGRGGNNVNGKTVLQKVATIAVVAFLVLGVLDSFYNVDEQENAVVTMFGQVLRTDTAGLHFKIPFVQKATLVDMTTHGTGIGYSVSGDGQNITNEDDGVMITSDMNFLNIDFYLEYKVSDPIAYLFNSERPEQILSNITLASIRSVVSEYTVDDAITTGKSQIQADVKDKLAKELDNQNIGIQVVNLQIQDAEPPTAEIIQAFKSVETAKQGKETAINNANKYKSEQIPQAEADADRITQGADAEKEARIADAQGQAARFNEMYEQYKKYPLITKKRLFYETMEDILPSLKVIITDGNTQEVLPLEKFSGSDATNEEAAK